MEEQMEISLPSLVTFKFMVETHVTQIHAMEEHVWKMNQIQMDTDVSALQGQVMNVIQRYVIQHHAMATVFVPL